MNLLARKRQERTLDTPRWVTEETSLLLSAFCWQRCPIGLAMMSLVPQQIEVVQR